MNHFSWLYDFFVRDNYDNHQEDEKRKDMLNLILPQVANMLVGFIKDEATDFGKEMLAKHFKELPKEVLSYLLRSYGNKINDDYSYISFRLIKDTNFLFSEPLAMLNTMYEKGNIDSNTGIALRDINKDDELFGNYGDSSQIKLI